MCNFGVEDLGGQMLPIFWGPSYKSIFPDLLLEEISETWGPSQTPLEKALKKVLYTRKWVESHIFDSRQMKKYL